MVEHSKQKPAKYDPLWLPPTRDNTHSIPVVPGVEVVTKVGPFDCTCYNERSPDLQNAFKGDCGKLTNHYLIHGIKENRDGSCQGGPFNTDCYYKEPVGATSNFEAHGQHDGTWLGLPPISCGLPPTRDNTNSIPVVPGVEVVTKARPLDRTCYSNRYPDLQNAFKGNRDGSCQDGPFNAAQLKNHWKDHGVKEKRIAGCATPVPPTAVAKLFKEKADYVCTAGYSQDGEPTGKRSFYETGQSDKPFSKKNNCKDIDWCIKYKTNGGQHGTCQDQLHGFTCGCEAGFEVALNEEGLQVCVDILECGTRQGHANCAPYGRCEDRVKSPVYKGDSGYAPTGGDTGRETCTARE
jgi:hypothetical protein